MLQKGYFLEVSMGEGACCLLGDILDADSADESCNIHVYTIIKEINVKTIRASIEKHYFLLLLYDILDKIIFIFQFLLESY